jgi:PAS domain S-box-containing protein
MEKAKILIIEDEAIIAMEVENQLQSLGYEVTSIVDTGEKAIKKAEDDKPDLILMDIRIKGEMDGIEAAEVIRNRFGIPVIFSTAYLDEERIDRAKITMPFGYVLKPIQERDLKVTLEMALYVAKVEVERKLSEKKLRDSESRLSLAIRSAKAGSWIWNIETGEVIWDERMQEIFGYAPGSFNGTYDGWKSRVHPDDREKADRQTKEALNSGTDYDFEYRLNIKTKDGDWRIVRAQAIVESNIQVGRIRMAGLCEDITERKIAQNKINELKEFYEEISQKAEDGIWVTDTHDKMIYFNPGMERISGVKAADAIGLSVVKDFPKETINHFITFYNKAKETLVPQQYEAEVVTPIGRRTFQSGWLVPRLVDGVYGGMICTIQDITKRKKNEEKTRESEQRLSQAHKLSHIGHWDWYMDTGELKWSDNIYEIFGQDKKTFEVTTESFEKAIHPDDFDAFIAEREKALTEERDLNIEHRIIHPDGSIRWVHEIAEIIRDDQGEVTQVMGVVQDISERKKVEDALKDQEKKFSAIFNESFQFALILDKKGTVLEMNKLCYDVCDDLAEGSENKPFEDALWWKDYEDVRQKTREAINKANDGIATSDEVVFIDKDRNLYDGMRIFSPISDENNEIKYIAVVGLDISNHKNDSNIVIRKIE